MLPRSTTRSIRAWLSDFVCPSAAVSISAPAHAIPGFRPALSWLAPLARVSASSMVIEFQSSYSRFRLFRPSVMPLSGSPPVLDLLCLLLTSGSAFHRLSTLVAKWLPTWHIARSPRVLRTHLHAYACRIYAASFRCQVSGFDEFGHLTPMRRLISARLESGQRFAIRLPSDSRSPAKPLPSANSSPCRASRGLSHPSMVADG